MNVYKLIRVLSDNNKMMLLMSHIIMVGNTINLALAINADRTEMFSYNVWAWMAGLVAFIIIQTKFSKE